MPLTNEEIVDELREKVRALNTAISALTGENPAPNRGYQVPSPTRVVTRNIDPAVAAARSQKMKDAWAKRRANEAKLNAEPAPTETVQAPPQAEVVAEVPAIPVEETPAQGAAPRHPARTKRVQ
jgi:hypothetical protein